MAGVRVEPSIPAPRGGPTGARAAQLLKRRKIWAVLGPQFAGTHGSTNWRKNPLIQALFKPSAGIEPATCCLENDGSIRPPEPRAR